MENIETQLSEQQPQSVHGNIELSNTPVAKKTRRAARINILSEIQLENGSILVDLSTPISKTPIFIGSARKVNETPRRSSRKSVRPPLDYEDIIEKNLMASTSKRNIVNADADAQLEEQPALRWTAAEVGQHSRKRSRSRKAKNKKTNGHEEINEEEPEAAKSEPLQPKVETNKAAASDTEEIIEQTVDTDNAIPKILAEDMDELGLSPLDAEIITNNAENDEEMPSLILHDDGEPGDVLNRTFDATDNSNEAVNKAVEMEIDPEEQDVNKGHIAMTKLQIPTINVLLADEGDQDVAHGNVNSKVSGYRFPTPFKSKANFQFAANKENVKESQNEDSQLVCSVRRRSKSFSEAKSKVVSFFSPVEVADVGEIDKRWEGFNNSHVTQRRKRSMSLDEGKSKVSRIPKPKILPLVKGNNTPSKLKVRTKLPNFAAIHQKQFEKMESLVDHVERKAVRAKVLSNSAMKQYPTIASAQKSTAKKLASGQTLGADRSRPKALKKIAIPSCTLTPLKPDEQRRQMMLPENRHSKFVAFPQTAPKVPLRVPLVSSIPKPAFNIYPSVAKIFTSTSSTVSSKPVESLQSKAEARRQRHMLMFKGRTVKENKADVIRGVRSNRRFELQMEHRRQLEANKK